MDAICNFLYLKIILIDNIEDNTLSLFLNSEKENHQELTEAFW